MTQSSNQSGQRSRMFLSVHLIGTAFTTFCIAYFHPYGPSPPEFYLSAAADVLLVYEVLVEAVLLGLPGWILGVVIAAKFRRLGLVVGATAISLTPILFFADIAVYATLRERLFTMRTYELVAPVVAWLPFYAVRTSFAPLLQWLGIYVVIQAVLLTLAWKASRTELQFQHHRQRIGVGAACVVALPLCALLWNVDAFQQHIANYSMRHPLALARIAERGLSELPTTTRLNDSRCSVHLHQLWPALERLEQRYCTLQTTNEPVHTPDIVLVIVESLRPDAITAKSAPHLHQFAANSLVSESHFSAGNGTELGFFGALYGLDPVCFVRATKEQWPPALPSLLKQAGYSRFFFFDMGHFKWRDMDRFVNENSFDVFETHSATDYKSLDAISVNKALNVLNREGRFEAYCKQPVFVLLYVYATHYTYDFGQEVASNDSFPHQPLGRTFHVAWIRRHRRASRARRFHRVPQF